MFVLRFYLDDHVIVNSVLICILRDPPLIYPCFVICNTFLEFSIANLMFQLFYIVLNHLWQKLWIYVEMSMSVFLIMLGLWLLSIPMWHNTTILMIPTKRYHLVYNYPNDTKLRTKKCHLVMLHLFIAAVWINAL